MTTAWVWFGSQKWVYDTLESVQKKEVMKVLSHTFLERAFCPHSYRWKPHLLRETNFPVQRDFNSQITTIPLNSHYMWPDGRGENNSKVRHEAIHNSLISNASKAHQWMFCETDCGHSLTTSDWLLARGTHKTPSHPGNHWQYTVHSSSAGGVQSLHTDSGGLFSWHRGSWFQIPSRHFQGVLHRLCLSISLATCDSSLRLHMSEILALKDIKNSQHGFEKNVAETSQTKKSGLDDRELWEGRAKIIFQCCKTSQEVSYGLLTESTTRWIRKICVQAHFIQEVHRT